METRSAKSTLEQARSGQLELQRGRRSSTEQDRQLAPFRTIFSTHRSRKRLTFCWLGRRWARSWRIGRGFFCPRTCCTHRRRFCGRCARDTMSILYPRSFESPSVLTTWTAANTSGASSTRTCHSSTGWRPKMVNKYWDFLEKFIRILTIFIANRRNHRHWTLRLSLR